MTKRTTPRRVPAKARSKAVSRTKEICVDAGVRNGSLGKRSARMAKITATSVCPASFSPAAQAEAALLADLDVVVEEPDEARVRP